MLRALRSFPVQMLLVFLALQAAFWWHSYRILPKMGVVPRPLSSEALKSVSFGDEEFTFRLMAFHLGNAGDTFGRATALKDYDLTHVKQWFFALDELNHQANILPSMASYYFSQTQDKPQVKHMVDYLEAYGKDRPKKWWWTAQATYLAMHKLEDSERALEIALPMQNMTEIPFWARQLAAFAYESRGEFDAAAAIIDNIIAHAEEIPPGELNFMRHFVEERISKLDALSTEKA